MMYTQNNCSNNDFLLKLDSFDNALFFLTFSIVYNIENNKPIFKIFLQLKYKK